MANQQPRSDDAVLGGFSQAPLDVAVLGGIEGVRQKLASDNEAVKKEGVLQALNYGEKGIEVLFGVLEGENNQDIWWLARHTLEKQGNPVIEARLKTYFHWYDYESVTVNSRGEIIQRTPGQARYYREDLGNGVYLDMVYIAGGSVLMGAPESERKSDQNERPQHRVTVPNFWLGKYQVTQAQWEVIMNNTTPYFAYFKGKNRPVDHATRHMCQIFCRKLSERTGKRYRLPSEVEWEYACRAGTTTAFNCGETITTSLVNYEDQPADLRYDYDGYPYLSSGEPYEYLGQTVDVGNFPPNAWGLYDMHGNVWEWCEDSWHEHENDELVVIRGGSWKSLSGHCRSDNRTYDNHYYGRHGLRLVLVSDGT